MNQVPNIISTKDLDYFTDMFNWNFTTSKIASSFSAQCQDDEVKQELESIAQMHAQICQKLITILGGNHE